MLLYPEGWTSDDLTYSASLHLPPNWKFGTSLAVASQPGAEIQFAPVSLTMLVDGPVITGEYLKIVPLNAGQTPPVEMDVAADSAAALDAPAEVWEHYKNLIAQTNALFGAQHYRDYHFLFSLSDHVAHFGLEHHESNDSRLGSAPWSIPRNAFWARDCCRTNLCTPGTENTGVPLTSPLLTTKSPCRPTCSGCTRASLNIWARSSPAGWGSERRRNFEMLWRIPLPISTTHPDAPGAICRTPPTAFPRCRMRPVSGSHGGDRSTTTKKMN
jgi:hypothetical protein